jgi:hypothetical protein
MVERGRQAVAPKKRLSIEPSANFFVCITAIDGKEKYTGKIVAGK